MSAEKSEITIQGIPASPGIAYGQVFVFRQRELDVPVYEVEPEKRVHEIGRLEQALLETRRQVGRIRDEIAARLGEEEARIFDAHLMVLEDQALIGETIRELESTGLNIESCIQKVSQRYVEAFERIDDDYFRERSTDIRDVTRRLLHNLMGQEAAHLGALADNRIVVAADITPSDSAGVDKRNALAVVTEVGSRTSHAVIVARSMNVPAVVAARDVTGKASTGDWAIVDGYDGLVVFNPTEQTLFRYGKIQTEMKNFESRIMAINPLAAETLDGKHLPLLANIEKEDETKLVRQYNAEGVGLYRTEFLYLDSDHIPTEEEQFAAYREVVEKLAPLPVTIRTLDLGGDKPMRDGINSIGHEANPFLGFRAIRFCLENTGLFKEQMRAILRASAFGKVKMMYPMISGVDELVRANALLKEAREELRERGEAFDEEMEVGSMIEIPSAAATLDLLAPHCDFFSVGTNDLIQYILAIDRVNERIAHLYEPTHPAVLRTLKKIFDDARRLQVTVSVCGEMAGEPIYLPLLLGMGADELSITPHALPAVKYLLRNMKVSEARTLTRRALEMADTRKVNDMLEEFHRERVAELIETAPGETADS